MTDFSVVIATKNNPEALKLLLESLRDAKEKYKNGKTEVIIVDDSDPSNRGLIHDAAVKYACRLQYFAGSGALKKNKGAEMAAYKVILFLDPDVTVRADIFTYYHDVFKDGAKAVAGPVVYSGADTFFWKSVNATPFMRRYYQPMYLSEVSWGVTANFAIYKKVFFETGGLDTSVRSDDDESLSEEAELGIKLHALNYSVLTAPEAIVYRPRNPWISYGKMTDRLRKYARAEVALGERNPNLKMKKSLSRNLMYLLAAVMSVFATLLFLNPWLLLPALGYYLTENVVIAVMMMRKDGNTKTSFFQQLMTEHLIHTGERAHILRCLRRFNFKLLNTRIIYYEKQIFNNFKMSRKMSLVQSVLFIAFCSTLILLGIIL